MRGKDFILFFWLLSLAVSTRHAPRSTGGSGFLQLTSRAFVAVPRRVATTTQNGRSARARGETGRRHGCGAGHVRRRRDGG